MSSKKTAAPPRNGSTYLPGYFLRIAATVAASQRLPPGHFSKGGYPRGLIGPMPLLKETPRPLLI
jgi:hypothetical protein